MTARVSLRWKVAGAVSVLLLSMTAVIGLALVRHERAVLLEEGGKRAVALAEMLAVSARDPLLERDELRMGPVIQSAMQDPDSVYAYVLDHHGATVYHSDTDLIGSSRDPRPEGQFGRTLEAHVPVVVEGTTVGEVFVGLSIGFVDRASRSTARGLLLRLGIGTLVALAGTLLLTDFHLRRIARLESAVERVAEGDMRVRANVSGRDELARLGHGFNSMVIKIERAREEIERGVTETVRALASTIEVNDAYTHGHCERVARGAAAIADCMGVDSAELREFELAAMLHDIGKIGVPSEILAKTSHLSESELLQMQDHAALGARILGRVSFLERVARYVRHHHENWDGSGYPDGLSGERIPLASSVIHVVDAYDAMTSNRPYRMASPHEEAIQRISSARGREFAPAVVDVFFELVDEGTIHSIRRRVDREEVA